MGHLWTPPTKKLGSISVPIKTDNLVFRQTQMLFDPSKVTRPPVLASSKAYSSQGSRWKSAGDSFGSDPETNLGRGFHHQNGTFLMFWCTKTGEFDHCKFGTWTSNLLEWGPTWSNTPQTDESWMHKPNMFFQHHSGQRQKNNTRACANIWKCGMPWSRSETNFLNVQLKQQRKACFEGQLSTSVDTYVREVNSQADARHSCKKRTNSKFPSSGIIVIYSIS